MNIFNILDFNDFNRISDKEFGIESGGVYELDNVKYMVKSMKANSVVAEYLGSNIANILLPGRAPEVFLVKNYKTGEVYVASKFLDNFNTLFDYKGKHDIDNIDGSEERDVVARFLTHDDEHQRNFGVIDDGQTVRAAVVDFSSSLQQYSNTILHSDWALKGTSINKILATEKFIAAIKAIAKLDTSRMNKLLEELFVSLKTLYQDDSRILPLLDGKHDWVKGELEKRIELCAKEEIIGRFLQSLDCKNTFITEALAQWIKMSSLSVELPKYLEAKFMTTVKDKNADDFFLLLPYMLTNAKHMKGAFQSAVHGNKFDFFKEILPYMKDYPEFMGTAFKESIRDDKLDFFKAMLPYMKGHPWSMEPAFTASIRDDKLDFFKAMLPYMKDRPEFMESAFNISVYGNEFNFFEAMLPYMKDYPRFMETAFENSVFGDKFDVFKAILPYMTDHPGLMEDAFYRSVYEDKFDFFKEMLPYIKDYPEFMGTAFRASVRDDKFDFFKAILPYVKDDPEIMRDPFEMAMYNNDQHFVKAMSPYMNPKPEDINALEIGNTPEQVLVEQNDCLEGVCA